MSTRTVTWLAWTMWGLTLCLTALALLFIFLNRSTQFPNDWCCGGFPGALTLTLVLASSTVGALIASRQAGNIIGWIFCSAGLAVGIELFALGYAVYTGLTQPGSLPGGDVMAWIASWIWIPGWGSILIFLLLLFPNGRLPSRRWRPIAWFVAGALAANMVTRAFMPGPLGWSLPVFRNPFGVEGAIGDALMAVEDISLTLLMLSIIASAISLILRLRKAAGVERQQIKWLTFAGAMAGIVFLASAIYYDTEIVKNPWVQGFLFAPFVGIPISAGIAILKYRLYDIDIIINRSLVYGALTASVVGTYVLVVGSLGALFQASGGFFLSILATGLIAFFFQPLRERLQRGVNRLLYGERDDPYAVLSRLGQRLEATIAPEAVLPTIVETVAETLKLPYAAIALDGDRGRKTTNIVASYGTPVDDLVRLPLVYQTEPIGQLMVAPRAAGELFTPADKQLLEAIAREVGVVAYAMHLNADVQRSRQRLVTAREEERRRLRRDLHDGLGATLAALHMQAGNFRHLIQRDPAAADALVSEWRAEIRTAIADIRRLVYDLRPATLDELGLVGAIRARAAQCNTPPETKDVIGLEVLVNAPEQLPPLPAAVEVAAYRIFQEALNNVVRHAHARQCTIRLSLDDALHLEITDDGIGVGRRGRAGVGLTSMRERAAELGGTCVIESVPTGGTRLRVWLPLPKE